MTKGIPIIIVIPTNSIRAGSRMKTIIGIIFIIIINIITPITAALAQSPTAKPSPTKGVSPTPTQTLQDSQIEKIKDLVASRVAELKLVDKKGILGTVKSASNAQIVVRDHREKELKIDIDELTKFAGADAKASFGISDIKSADFISAIGLYNKDTQRLLARFVKIAANIPTNLDGVVIEKDSEEFTITIGTKDGKKYVVNVETSTKTSIHSEGETVRSGFSKVVVNERVIVVGFPDKTEKDQINASRIIHFPDMELSTELKKHIAETSPEAQ